MPDWMLEWAKLIGLPAALAFGGGAVSLFRWWVDRRDARRKALADGGASATAQEAERLAVERASLSKELRDEIERMETERDQARAAEAAVRGSWSATQRELDVAWVLVRRYWRLCWDMMLALHGARELAERDPSRRPAAGWREFHVPDRPEELT